MQNLNLIAQSVLKLSHCENNNTHQGWIIVHDGKYSVADKNLDTIWIQNDPDLAPQDVPTLASLATAIFFNKLTDTPHIPSRTIILFTFSKIFFLLTSFEYTFDHFEIPLSSPSHEGPGSNSFFLMSSYVFLANVGYSPTVISSLIIIRKYSPLESLSG